MCSIIGSFDKEKIKELVKLNQHRGNFSYSISVFDKNNNLVKQIKNFGKFDETVLDNIYSNNYYVCHVQAPTGGMVEDINRIHPTEINSSMLWHNGIITPRGMRFLNQVNGNTETFDTKALHEYIISKPFDELSNVEGLFACVYYEDSKTHIFRTKHGKLFVDNELNISSERFENSKCINYDTVYKIDFENKKLMELDNFKTNKYNIIVPGEM